MIHLRKTALVLFVALFLTASAQAQDATRIERRATPSKQTPAQGSPEILHVTNHLNRTPEAKRALESFRATKAKGLIPTGKTAPALQPGARATFKVLTNVTTTPSWEEQNFTLKASSDIAQIWVEDGQLSMNHVTDQHVSDLQEALLYSTPAGSIDPQQGIIANENRYFGDPPNVDGDGRVDILLYDIEEGTSISNSYVAGFVTSQDLSTFGGGNHKDILYLDTDPGVKSRPISSVLATAAHEYQHLIHFNYDRLEVELDFSNEGLSEWAEVLNGYPARTMSFLKDPATYNVRLFGWNEGLDDYQRAGLFVGYLAERAPAESVASLTRISARGRAGYEEMLLQEGLDFEAVLMDYHTANFENSPAADPWFVYNNPAFNGVLAVATEEIDGRASESTPETTAYIEAGSVEYTVWKNVTDFTFTMDTIEPFASIRDRIRVRALLRGAGGESRFEDLQLPLIDHRFAGSFDEVTLSIVHVQPELTSRVGVRYDAAWSNSTRGTITYVTYDDGQVASDVFFSLSAGTGGAAATRFELPAPGQSRLLEVQVSPFYLNQFSNSDLSANAPRDLTLTVWSEGADGKPNEVLFSREVADSRPFALATQTLNHFSVDLEDAGAVMSRLPDVVYIGYTEAGSDANYMVVGPSTYTTADISYVTRRDGAWGALWETKFSDSGENDFPLSGMVVPVRAVFEVLPQPVSSEDESALPRRDRAGAELPESVPRNDHALVRNRPPRRHRTGCIRHAGPARPFARATPSRSRPVLDLLRYRLPAQWDLPLHPTGGTANAHPAYDGGSLNWMTGLLGDWLIGLLEIG